MTTDRLAESERLLAMVLVLYPLKVPGCAAFVDRLRHAELRDFIARLCAELVASPDDDAQAVLMRVLVRPGGALLDVLREVERRRGFKDPSRILSEAAAGEVMEDFRRAHGGAQ